MAPWQRALAAKRDRVSLIPRAPQGGRRELTSANHCLTSTRAQLLSSGRAVLLTAEAFLQPRARGSMHMDVLSQKLALHLIVLLFMHSAYYIT